MGASDLTRLLNEAAAGTPGAAERLLPMIYEELRAMARRQVAQDPATIEPTALVHEAWLRLNDGDAAWDHRGHFFAAAAQAMRRILVERARALRALRRGGGVQPATTPVDELPITIPDPATLLDLEVALRDLETRHPRQARVVLLRYFAGLEMNAIADVLGISLGSVERDWRLARARLARQLGPDR